MFAVFLDRDGVINEEVSYLRDIEQLTFLPRSVQGLSRLSAEYGPDVCKVVIVTNQSMIGRGMCSEEQFKHISGQYLEAVQRESGGKARIDDCLYCPHHPTKALAPYRIDCSCRKPKIGMFLKAQQRFCLDLESSYMIGDRATDILAGQAAGCFSIMVRTGYGGDDGSGIESSPDAWCDDLYAAIDLIRDRVTA